MKEIKLLEICFAGSNSVLGGMVDEMGADKVSNFNAYKWVLFVDTMAFDMIEDECKKIKLTDYIIVGRHPMRISSK